jgi:hypothetical protein
LIAIELDAAGLDLLTGGGSMEAAEFGFGFREKLIEFEDTVDNRGQAGQTEQNGNECDIKGLVRDAGSDSENIRGSGRVVHGAGGYAKEKLIGFDIFYDTKRVSHIMGIGSDSVIDGFVRMMIDGFVYLIGFGMSDDFGRFYSRNVLYDPGGSVDGVDLGLSSWGAIGDQCFQPSYPWRFCCCCYLESPLSVQDFLDHEQSVFLEFEVSSSLCAATSRMLRCCSTIE